MSVETDAVTVVNKGLKKDIVRTIAEGCGANGKF